MQCLGGSKTITPSREARLTSLVHRVYGRVDGAVVGVYMASSAVLDARVGAHLWGKSGGAVVGTCMQGRGRVSELTENLLYGQMSPMDA